MGFSKLIFWTNNNFYYIIEEKISNAHIILGLEVPKN